MNDFFKKKLTTEKTILFEVRYVINKFHPIIINKIMKKISIPALLALVTMLMSSCSVIEGIFKAGVWVGIIVVVVVIAIIIWIVSKIL